MIMPFAILKHVFNYSLGKHNICWAILLGNVWFLWNGVKSEAWCFHQDILKMYYAFDHEIDNGVCALKKKELCVFSRLRIKKLIGKLFFLARMCIIEDFRMAPVCYNPNLTVAPASFGTPYAIIYKRVYPMGMYTYLSNLKIGSNRAKLQHTLRQLYSLGMRLSTFKRPR